MLLHFERELAGLAEHGVLDRQRVVDAGEAAGELHVHNRADDLNDFAFIHDV